MQRLLKFALLGSVCAASAAIAQTSNRPATTKIGPQTDPKQILCITDRAIGSRVTPRRVCRTRAEWQEHRLQLRGELDTVLQPTTAG